MTGPVSGFDIDKWVADAKAKAVRYQQMREQAEHLSVTESSKDELVTVTVDASGNLTDLQLGDEVAQLRGSQVAAAVMATLRKAQSRLPEQMGEVMRANIGDDPSTVDTVVSRFKAKFPEPEPDEDDIEQAREQARFTDVVDQEVPDAPPPPAQPSPRARPSGPDEEDDFEHDAIVHDDE